MVSLPTPLNISCSCTECTVFLRPIQQRSPPKSPHLNPFAAEYIPSIPSIPWTPLPLAPQRSRTTSWVDKLSLYTYPTRGATSPSFSSSSSSSSRMSISTTSRTPSPSRSSASSKNRVVFEMKCTYEGCDARIPITSLQSLLGSALCEEHGDELRDCVREMVMANWAGKSVAMSPRASAWRSRASSEDERARYFGSPGRYGSRGSRTNLQHGEWGIHA